MYDSPTVDQLLAAYKQGIFPMSQGRDDRELTWHKPCQRGVLPLDHRFRLSRRLARTVLGGRFDVTADRDFSAVIAHCAFGPGREETWISRRIQGLYEALNQRGNAHSVEIWDGSDLVGGLYGVSIGGAFFGESMFSRRSDASKIALVHLVAALRLGGFVLLDTQFVTAHLETFGCLTVQDEAYRSMLDHALGTGATWCQDVALGRLRAEIQKIRRETVTSEALTEGNRCLSQHAGY